MVQNGRQTDEPDSTNEAFGEGASRGHPSPLPDAKGLRPSAGAGRTDGGVPSDLTNKLTPGVTLANRYEIRELLGAGGMGAVYKVVDRVRDKEVALKVMLPSLVETSRAAERFRHEVEIMLALSHPGIVRVHDVGEDPDMGLRFFTMELLKGQTLREWLDTKKKAKEPVEADEALEITRQLLEALRYAHRLTVHRDLKPENVFLCSDAADSADGEGPRVKILDFGIAKLQSSSQLTSTAMALGTAFYMAPEQQEDAGNVDQRADLYALAVMLYEMLTGRLPVGHFKSPAEQRKALPRVLDDLVLRGLAPEPDQRYETAERLLAEVTAIRRVLERGGARRASRPVMVAVGVVVLGVIGIVASKPLWQPSPTPSPRQEAQASNESEESEGAGIPLVTTFRGVIDREAPIEITAKDRAGNGASKRVHVVRDATRPKLEIRSPDTLSVLTNLKQLEVRGRLVEANPDRLEVGGKRISWAEDGTFQTTVALVSEGVNNIPIVAEDKAGNRSEPILLVIHRDTRSPGLLITETPEETSNLKIELTGSVDEDACSVEVAVNGEVTVVSDKTFRVNANLRRGTNEVTFTARDRAGNHATRGPFRIVCQPRGWDEEPLPLGLSRARVRPVLLWTKDLPGGAALEIEMVYVKPGGFWIARNETTWGQYRAFCRGTGRKEPPLPTRWKPDDDHPVVNVSWQDATAFCDWAELALPTEAQWELAARGETDNMYPWGPTWDPKRLNWTGEGRYPFTAPVGSFPQGASPYGALDMAGNVAEWCADTFGRGLHVARGGAYSNSKSNQRVKKRKVVNVEAARPTFGFRPVKPMR